MQDEYQQLDQKNFLSDYEDFSVTAPTNYNFDKLPFRDLPPRVFERLCLRYCFSRYGADKCTLYGYPGQKQYGLDVLVRVDDDKYILYQCKHVESFAGSDLIKAINVFQEDKNKEKWFSKTVEFVLFSSNELIDNSFIDVFEEQRKILNEQEITLSKIGGGEISEKLRNEPEIVYEFFGEIWVRGFVKREIYEPFFERLVPLPEKRNYEAPSDYIPRSLSNPEKVKESYGYTYHPSQPLTEYIGECHQEGKPARVVIRSDAGLGKSKELDYLAHYFNSSRLFPIIVRLKLYDGDLEVLIKAFYEKWKFVPKERLLILFDGLDEVPNGLIDDFLKKFNLFLQSYSGSNIIATARRSFSLKSVGDGVDEKSILKPQYLKPLDEDDIIKYLRDRDLTIKKQEDFKNICKQRHLLDLLQNPFYLKNLVDLFQHPSLTFPSDRADAIARIIELKLEQDRKKYPVMPDSSLYIIFAKRLAVYLTLTGKNSLNKTELNELTSLTGTELRYCSLFSREETGEDFNIYFEHNNFQEYLAADFLQRLEWPVLKCLLFHEPKYDILKPRLVNTTNYLFTLLNKNTKAYEPFFKTLKDHNPELLLSFEKDKIRLEIRMNIIKELILEGKKEGIYYLRGKFEVLDLLEFIDHSPEVLPFIFDELTQPESSSIHKKCLLEILFNFKIENVTGNGRRSLHRMLIDIIQTTQQPAVHDMAIDVMTRHLFTSDTNISHCIKKCPNIDSKVVRASILKMIKKARADKYFPYILKSAVVLFPQESMSIAELGSDFLETILDFLDHKRAIEWLKFTTANTNLVANILDNMYDPLERLTIEKIHSKIADLYIEQPDPKLFIGYTDFISSVHADLSEGKWGNLALFYIKTNTSEQAFFDLLYNKDDSVLFRTSIGADLLDQQIIDRLLTQIKAGKVKIDAARQTRNLLHYFDKHQLFEYINEKLLSDYPDYFKPSEPTFNWNELDNLRTLRDFEILKDKPIFLDEANKVFDEVGKLRNSDEDWSYLRYDERVEIKKVVTNNIIFRIIERNNIGGYSEFKDWIDSWEWDWFLFVQFYTYLIEQKKSPPEEWIKWLQNYVVNDLLNKTLNFKKSLIKQPDGRYAALTSARMVRNLYMNGHIQLPQGVLLDMLSFDTSGFTHIEPHPLAKEHLFKKIYEDIIDKESFKQRVLKNLNGAFPESRVLETHCTICLQLNLTEAIPLLVDHLQKRSTSSDVKSSLVTTLIKLEANLSILASELIRVKIILADWQWDLFKVVYEAILAGYEGWSKEKCLKLADKSIKKHTGESRIKWRLIKASIKLGSSKAADNVLRYLTSNQRWSDYADIDANDFESIANYNPQKMIKSCFQILGPVLINNSQERHNSSERFLTQLIRQLSIKSYKLMLFSMDEYEKLVVRLIVQRPELVVVRWYKKDLVNDYYIKTSTFEDEREVLTMVKKIA